MSSHASLDAAAQQRKNRLAQLKSLKRKHSESTPDQTSHDRPATTGVDSSAAENSSSQADATSQYLSGRNFDIEARGPKLGFDNAPNGDSKTLEQQASAEEAAVREQAAAKEKEDKPLDLFDLQPKKPNWDLKRDLQKKLDILNVRTDNAIAKLVRQRIETAQKSKAAASDGSLEAVGELDGARLVEATRVREREDDEDRRREEEDDMLDP